MNVRRYTWGAIVCSLGIACGGADGADTGSQRPADPAVPPEGSSTQTSLTPASATTKVETGITTWEIRGSKGGYHIVGRNGEDVPIVDFHASNIEGCHQSKGSVVPVASESSGDHERAVTLGCSTGATNRAVDSTTELLWAHATTDLGPAKRQTQAQNFSPNEAPWCAPGTDLMCCGGVTLWCEDHWTDENFQCVYSGWYICGVCVSPWPWCEDW